MHPCRFLKDIPTPPNLLSKSTFHSERATRQGMLLPQSAFRKILINAELVGTLNKLGGTFHVLSTRSRFLGSMY